MADQLGRAEDVRTRADRLRRRERLRVDGVTFTRQNGSVKLVDNPLNKPVTSAVGADGELQGPIINGILVGPDGTLTRHNGSPVAQDRSSAGAGRGSVSEGHGAKQPEPVEPGASWVVPAVPPDAGAGRDRTGGRAVDDPGFVAEKGFSVSSEASGGGPAADSTQTAPSAAAKKIQQERAGRDGHVR